MFVALWVYGVGLEVSALVVSVVRSETSKPVQRWRHYAGWKHRFLEQGISLISEDLSIFSVVVILFQVITELIVLK